MISKFVGVLSLLLCLAGCWGGCGSTSDPYKRTATASIIALYNAPQAPNTSLEITPGVAVEAKDFMIEARTIRRNSNASTSSLVSYLGSKINVSLFNSAHACSPPLTALEQSIRYFEITSDSAFSEQYPAGSSLNELFKIVYFDGADLSGLDLDDLTDPYDVRYDSGYILSHIQLKLTQAPTSSLSHDFSIKINSEDSIALETVVFK